MRHTFGTRGICLENVLRQSLSQHHHRARTRNNVLLTQLRPQLNKSCVVTGSCDEYTGNSRALSSLFFKHNRLSVYTPFGKPCQQISRPGSSPSCGNLHPASGRPVGRHPPGILTLVSNVYPTFRTAHPGCQNPTQQKPCPFNLPDIERWKQFKHAAQHGAPCHHTRTSAAPAPHRLPSSGVRRCKACRRCLFQTSTKTSGRTASSVASSKARCVCQGFP